MKLNVSYCLYANYIYSNISQSLLFFIIVYVHILFLISLSTQKGKSEGGWEQPSNYNMTRYSKSVNVKDEILSTAITRIELEVLF